LSQVAILSKVRSEEKGGKAKKEILKEGEGD